jgi:hypothetical protein
MKSKPCKFQKAKGTIIVYKIITTTKNYIKVSFKLYL